MFVRFSLQATFDEAAIEWERQLAEVEVKAAILRVGRFLSVITVFHPDTVKAFLSTAGMTRFSVENICLKASWSTIELFFKL